MDRGMRNSLIGVIGSIVIVFFGAWVQINSRISILEVQVQNDRELFLKNSEKADKQMNELMNKVNDIQVKVTELAVKVQEDKK